MPILAKEPHLFPDHLFSLEDLGRSAAERWWALYTRSRREKQLMRYLLSLQVPFFCPLAPQTRRSPAGRVRTSFLPLFANYVFLYGDGTSHSLALKTNCVSRTIAVPDDRQLTHDLRQIHFLLQKDVPVMPETKVEAGARVRIRSGFLAGLEGIVVKRDRQRRLIVAVDFLQQGASVLLDDFDIEPIA